MYIGLIIYGSLDTLSGGYLYDRVVVEHLRSAGDTVEIISLTWRSYLRHLMDNFDGALSRRLRQARFDVLVQDELNHPSLFWLNHRLRARVTYPVVSIVHHLRASEQRPAWQNAMYRLIERRYLASVDGFIFNSQTTRQVVEGLVGRGRPSVVATPAGDRLAITMTEDDIAARARAAGPLRIFFLGNLIHRKGLHVLIAALASLPSTAWTLSVAGSPDVEPDYARGIRRQIEAARLGDRVSLLGSLSGEALIGQMRAGHVLVMPSSYEGYGIAYLEGMGMGLPAIGTTAGAAHEVITHGVDGFLVPPDDPLALAGHLRTLAEDREALVRMGRAARARFDRQPTWQQTAARVREFLVEMSHTNVRL